MSARLPGFLKKFLPYLIYLALTIPFVGKAFDIDDALFLAMARQIRVDPLRPLDFKMVWDEKKSDQARHPNPPLQAYLLATVGAVAGESEVAMHLAMLPFGLLAIWATGLLAIRFGVPVLGARLLMASSPALALCSQTVMPDVTLLAFLVVGVAFALRGLDDDRRRDAAIGGVFLGCALLLRYNAAGMLLLLGLYPWMARLPKRQVLLTIGVALLFPLAWNLLTWATDGVPHIAAAFGVTRANREIRDIAVRAAVAFFHIGGAAVFPPLILLAFTSDRRHRQAAIIVGVVWAGVLAASWERESGMYPPMVFIYPLFFLPGFLLFASGIDNLLGAIRNWRSRERHTADSAFLFLWIFGMAFAPLLYVHVAAKYLIPALPALILLVAGRTGARGRGRIAVAVIAGLILSPLASITEMSRADAGPVVATKMVKPLVAMGKRVWFSAEWGYSIYLSRAGALPLHKDAKPAPGDYVVACQVTPPAGLIRKMFRNLRPVTSLEFRSPSPVVTMDKKRNAGYWSQFWGWVPFSVAVPPVISEKVTLYEILPGSIRRAG